MAEAALRLEGIVKRFGSARAVDGVDLEVRAGEFFALLGPSGCGKTTLMRIAAGFEAADAGRVYIDGRDVGDAPAHLRPANMMFQSYALFPHLTAAENIAYGLRRAGRSRAGIAARVAEMVELARLEGLETRKPDQLSGGQKQRVALARALARGPKLVLLDEPLAALDRKMREETQFALKRIQRSLGVAFLVVTHDQDEAMGMADRVAVMRAGRIEQSDAPEALYARPASRFVAGFVGEANLFDVRAARREEEGALYDTEAGVLSAPLFEPAPAALCVRPEDVRLQGAGDNVLVGEAYDRIFRGDGALIRIRLPTGQLVRAMAPASAPFEPGAPARAVFDARRVTPLPR